MTPDLDRLLRIAAAELPPGHQIVIRVEKGWGGVALDDGDIIEYDTQGDETLAQQVERLLKELGILLTEREDD